VSRMFTFILLILIGYSTDVNAQRPQQELWISPLAQEFNGKKWGAVDFLEMFNGNAQWETVAKYVRVFKLYPTFIGSASDAVLRQVFEDLRRRRIKIALEGSMLASAEGCGGKVSSDSGEFTVRLVERIHRLGGHLDYLAMNEPLLHAIRQKQRLCSDNIETMAARNVSKLIQEVRQYFPNVEVGDIEAIGTWAGTKGVLDSIGRWADAFQAETGRKLAFMHADVGWILPWLDTVGRLGDEMHKRNIPFGIIYNGIDTDLSDEAWIKNAEEHFLQYENSNFRLPDMAIFQSWAEYPRHILPENRKYALTALVLRYLQRRTILRAEQHESSVIGRLVDEQNAPLADVPVTVFTRPVKGYGPVGWSSVSGIVPQSAIRASFTISMNFECACKARSSIKLKKFEYAERIGKPPASIEEFSKWKSIGKGKISNNSDVEIITELDQRSQFVSPEFPTEPGAEFDARLLFQAPYRTESGGLGILKFFNSEHKEVRRTYIFFDPNWERIAETKTQADGSFKIFLRKEYDLGNSKLKITSSGSEFYRPSQNIQALRK
jgi:hypothetical protein